MSEKELKELKEQYKKCTRTLNNNIKNQESETLSVKEYSAFQSNSKRDKDVVLPVPENERLRNEREKLGQVLSQNGCSQFVKKETKKQYKKCFKIFKKNIAKYNACYRKTKKLRREDPSKQGIRYFERKGSDAHLENYRLKTEMKRLENTLVDNGCLRLVLKNKKTYENVNQKYEPTDRSTNKDFREYRRLVKSGNSSSSESYSSGGGSSSNRESGIIKNAILPVPGTGNSVTDRMYYMRHFSEDISSKKSDKGRDL